MSRTKLDVYKHEKYMSDATLAAHWNFVRALKRKNNSIWSLDEDDIYTVLTNLKTPDSFSENNQDIKTKKKSISSVKNLESNNNHYHERVRMGWSSMSSIETKSKVKEQINADVYKEVVGKKHEFKKKQNISAYAAATLKESDETYESSEPNRMSVKKDFQGWCLKRKEDHKNSARKMQQSHKDESSLVSMKSQIVSKSNNGEEKYVNQSVKIKKKISKMENCSSPMATKLQTKPKKCSGNDGLTRKEMPSTLASTDNHQLIIKITYKDGHSQEIMTDYKSFLQRKKIFPKLLNVIPDVDTTRKEVNFSADAMKAILEFLFNPCYRFDRVANEQVGVEILAAAQSWEIKELQKEFQDYFVKQFLSESNALDIYSICYLFGLKEICDICKNIAKSSNDWNVASIRYNPRKCNIKVSTYREALEYPIHLYSVMKEFTDNFNKSIDNNIVFEAISGCFIITGIEITLNMEKGKINNSSDLKIFYSAENITEKKYIKEQTAYKPLRPTNIIYFEEGLVVKPKEKARISIYTDIKPCLCLTFKNESVRQKSPEGEFLLTLQSNFKVQNSDRKRFFIGKIFYHVKKD